MKKFKNEISVTGSLHYLEAFEKYIITLGYERPSYKGTKGWDYLKTYRSGGSQYNNHDGAVPVFALPSEWDKALKLVSEVEEEEVFKVGDWVMCETSKYSEFTKGHLYKVRESKDRYGNLGLELDNRGSKTNGIPHEYFRLATKEEIEKHLIEEKEKEGWVKGAKTNNGVIDQIFLYKDWEKVMGRSNLPYKNRDLELCIKYDSQYWGWDFVNDQTLLPSCPEIKIGCNTVEFSEGHVTIMGEHIAKEAFSKQVEAFSFLNSKNVKGILIKTCQGIEILVTTDQINAINDHFKNQKSCG